MKFINNIQVLNLLTMEDTIRVIKDVLILQDEDKVNLPNRIIFDMSKGQQIYMPVYIKEHEYVGIKIISTFLNNHLYNVPSVNGIVVINSSTTGEVLAMLDADAITQIRTGALQAIATDLLAPLNSNSAIIIGAGHQAYFQIIGLLTVRNLKKIYIHDLNMNNARNLAKKIEKKFDNVEFIVIKNPDDVIDHVDIINTMTPSENPTFSAEKLKKGVHINGMGAFTHNMREIPPLAFEKAGFIFCDNKNAVLKEAGDIIFALKKQNHIQEKIFELSNLITSPNCYNINSSQDITIFNSVGNAAFDIIVAFFIYNKLGHNNA